MRRTLGPLAIVAAMAGVPAHAAGASARCDLSPSTALGTAIASAGYGGVVAITGICQPSTPVQVEEILTFTNRTGTVPSSLSATDGIQGGLQIIGPFLVIVNGISLEGTATDTGLFSTVLLQGGAAAIIENSQIINGQRVGLEVEDSAAVIVTSTISNNGLALVEGQTDGIRAVDGSHIVLGSNSDGAINAGAAATVSGNNGNGIFIGSHSGLTMIGGTIEDNTQDQLLVAGTSTASLLGVQVTQTQTPTNPGGFAIQVLGTSAILLAEGASVSSGSVAGGVQAITASGIVMIGSTVSNNSASRIAVQASRQL